MISLRLQSYSNFKIKSYSNFKIKSSPFHGPILFNRSTKGNFQYMLYANDVVSMIQKACHFHKVCCNATL